MRSIAKLTFSIVCVASNFSLLSMSKIEKVYALAKLWQKTEQWSRKQEKSKDAIKWNMASYKWDIQAIVEWNEGLGELYYGGLIIYKTVEYRRQEKGLIGNFAQEFNGAQIIRNWNCFRNNRFFTLIPVLLDQQTHLYLFRFPVSKKDAALTFVQDLGAFEHMQQCDISYDASCVRIGLEDGTVHTITIKIPGELIFKPKNNCFE